MNIAIAQLLSQFMHRAVFWKYDLATKKRVKTRSNVLISGPAPWEFPHYAVNLNSQSIADVLQRAGDRFDEVGSLQGDGHGGQSG